MILIFLLLILLVLTFVWIICKKEELNTIKRKQDEYKKQLEDTRKIIEQLEKSNKKLQDEVMTYKSIGR